MRATKWLGRNLIDVAVARRRGLPVLELQTRVELVENHAAFAALGFAKAGESAHEGHDTATSIILQKLIEARG